MMKFMFEHYDNYFMNFNRRHLICPQKRKCFGRNETVWKYFFFKEHSFNGQIVFTWKIMEVSYN